MDEPQEIRYHLLEHAFRRYAHLPDCQMQFIRDANTIAHARDVRLGPDGRRENAPEPRQDAKLPSRFRNLLSRMVSVSLKKASRAGEKTAPSPMMMMMSSRQTRIPASPTRRRDAAGIRIRRAEAWRMMTSQTNSLDPQGMVHATVCHQAMIPLEDSRGSRLRFARILCTRLRFWLPDRLKVELAIGAQFRITEDELDTNIAHIEYHRTVSASHDG
ncbi:hypothetical protein PVAG01_10792 [Phlyctema vagabunda]|uniref:Uncharacterized protein n=1 Tax=Phlyctema vagabunda TaxID=108571 RepID=A0ABR4P394_9HELO